MLSVRHLLGCGLAQQGQELVGSQGCDYSEVEGSKQMLGVCLAGATEEPERLRHTLGKVLELREAERGHKGGKEIELQEWSCWVCWPEKPPGSPERQGRGHGVGSMQSDCACGTLGDLGLRGS